MLRTLKASLEVRRRKRAAFEHALQAFVAKYPQRPPLKNWKIPDQLADKTMVVTIVYSGNSLIPPPRSWWNVNLEASVATELSYDEAPKLISIPPWR
jgi:hypothetical protein